MSVNVNDADWQKIQELFAKERQWMTDQMQKHIREVNEMFYDERKGFGSGTRNTMKPILVTMCNISSGSSASLDSLSLAWLSSCYSIAITTGRSNLLFPTWLVGFILGTTSPLTIGISAENQWVCLFGCQS